MEDANEDPVKSKRQRGTKRKEENLELESKKNSSKRGRPKKTINYCDIANPTNVDKELKSVSYSPKHSRPIPNEGKSTESPSTTEKDYECDEDESKDETLKGRKYTYTGETVKLMQTLFTACKIENTNSKVRDIDNGSGNGNVICAVCNQELEKPSQWTSHKLKIHNNLAWKIGEQPLDLTDRNFVMATLNALYKQKKPLYCNLCGQSKKSVVGFLSHQSTCNKSADELEDLKISCEICGKRMMPVSKTSHMKTHTTPKPEIFEEVNKSINVEGPSRRVAAQKALQLINNINEDNEYIVENINYSEDFAKDLMRNELKANSIVKCKLNCEFSSNNLEEMIRHLEECKEKMEQTFTCKKCLKSSNSLIEIIAHLKVTHQIILEDKDPNFVENSSYSSSQSSAVQVPNFVRSTERKSSLNLSPFGFRWTLQFCQDNYNKEILFEDYLPNNWPLVDRDQVSNYLPKLNESCQFDETIVNAFIPPKLFTDYKFKTLQLFESCLNPKTGTSTIFCGGPITATAWLPTPYDNLNKNQFLAIAAQNSPDSVYILRENYQENTTIQFWNFGNLSNIQKPSCKPEFSFGLISNLGPIWHMEWCPSGCFNEDKDRMGLLAVAGSDGGVHIFSIPFPHKIKGLFYKPKPVIKLLLRNCTLGGNNYYATKISWTHASNHNYIAVGFSNGFVALYNLNRRNSPLLRRVQDGVDCYYPFKYFQAHLQTLTILVVHHLNGGCRWLLTGSLDRFLKLWDLNDTNYPAWSVKRSVLVDGQWPKNWLCNIVGCDESSTTLLLPSLINQPCNYLFDHMSLLFSKSTVNSISVSDWLNGVVQGNTVGEISAIFPSQFLHAVDKKSTKTKRLMFGYNFLIRKNNNSGTLSYTNATHNLGLVFHDHKMESNHDFSDKGKRISFGPQNLQNVKPEHYPLQQINKIAFNPNRQASLYFGTAYQSGLVRVTWMQFLAKDVQNAKI